MPAPFTLTMLATGALLALVACGNQTGTDPAEAPVSVPAADAAMVTQAAEGAAAAAAAAAAPTNPLCAKATFAEVSAAAGGNFDKVDVIDEAELDYLDCVYLDSKDLYAGLTIRFVSNGKLVATSSKWPTAAAYFDEWGRSGSPVADVGKRAAWIDLPSGLLVQKGDHAMHFSASTSDLSDPAVRARFETLARAVVARLP